LSDTSPVELFTVLFLLGDSYTLPATFFLSFSLFSFFSLLVAFVGVIVVLLDLIVSLGKTYLGLAMTDSLFLVDVIPVFTFEVA